MKVQIKREPQQIAFNYLPDIDFKDFLNLYKECTAKPYFFWAIEATPASDTPSGILSMLAHVGCLAKVSDHPNLKILSPKQMLQRLPITIAQVKAGNII